MLFLGLDLRLVFVNSVVVLDSLLYMLLWFSVFDLLFVVVYLVFLVVWVAL